MSKSRLLGQTMWIPRVRVRGARSCGGPAFEHKRITYPCREITYTTVCDDVYAWFDLPMTATSIQLRLYDSWREGAMKLFYRRPYDPMFMAQQMELAPSWVRSVWDPANCEDAAYVFWRGEPLWRLVAGNLTEALKGVAGFVVRYRPYYVECWYQEDAHE